MDYETFATQGLIILTGLHSDRGFSKRIS